MARELYDSIGISYAKFRKPDPRFAAAIRKAIGDAKRVVNVGAGTGSYEPADCDVVAVEPSETMIQQRPADAAPVVRASAMDLPFRDNTFDAALAMFTVHHWPDQADGLRELARVAKRRVILTWDPEHLGTWLTRDYFPQINELGRAYCLRIRRYRELLDDVKIMPVTVPCDCTDGFLHAYWARPRAYLDPGIRSGISVFSNLDGLDAGLDRLKHDLDTGIWESRNAHLMSLSELETGYRLIVSN